VEISLAEVQPADCKTRGDTISSIVARFGHSDSYSSPPLSLDERAQLGQTADFPSANVDQWEASYPKVFTDLLTFEGLSGLSEARDGTMVIAHVLVGMAQGEPGSDLHRHIVTGHAEGALA
jgi:hypothetical protein